MIRLDRVELLHWDMQPHQVLPLAQGVTLLTGENGSGKTSILDALKIGLGAPRLEGDRSVEGYLLKQARPLAMIRILVDNRPAPGTRHRPFDALGEQSQDVVTLAVVFRADDEKHYQNEYFILDGDVVPLETGAVTAGRKGGKTGFRPLPSGAEYRARLKKVGIGPRYLKLLCLPQGQIASFCRLDGARLFDDLYDIIGGRQALDTWEDRLKDLNRKQREHEAIEKELDAAQGQLKRMEDKVRRHEEFLKVEGRLHGFREATPHVKLRDARRKREELAEGLRSIEEELRRLERQIETAHTQEDLAAEALNALDGEALDLTSQLKDKRTTKDRILGQHYTAKSRLTQLEQLRTAAQGVTPQDPEHLQASLEVLRQQLAEGQAAHKRRMQERGELETDLEGIRQGLLPFPAEVNTFREKLRNAGIPHHLLAEVLEVTDDTWREAMEGYLGRLRFAVLVQDPDAWPKAAQLAREMHYPHGVLAPDVRGSSPLDDDSLASHIDVKEPRYRALVARLLRPVIAGTLPSPLSPPRRGELLDVDAFVVSRIEARHAPAGKQYLGRDALVKRRQAIEAQLAVLQAETSTWKEEEQALRRQERVLEADLKSQATRLAWEDARDEHSTVRAQEAGLAEEVATLGTEVERLDALKELVQKRILEQTRVKTAAHTAAEQLQKQQTTVNQRHQQLLTDLQHADDELGKLLAQPLVEPSPDTLKVLAEDHSLRTLASLTAELEAQCSSFSPEERDTLLPTNFDRQRLDVEAVGQRLLQLGTSLDATKAAAEDARDQYQRTTRLVFKGYFGKLKEAASALEFKLEGSLDALENGRFRCELRVQVGEKPAVHHNSEELSGGQKAALSILMGMTAVSLESDSAGFFLIDEPFSASDVNKINELGRFLERTGAQYLISMPTSADVAQCGDCLQATWLCTRSKGGFDARGRIELAPPVKLGFASAAREQQAEQKPPANREKQE